MRLMCLDTLFAGALVVILKYLYGVWYVEQFDVVYKFKWTRRKGPTSAFEENKPKDMHVIEHFQREEGANRRQKETLE